MFRKLIAVTLVLLLLAMAVFGILSARATGGPHAGVRPPPP